VTSISLAGSMAVNGYRCKTQDQSLRFQRQYRMEYTSVLVWTVALLPITLWIQDVSATDINCTSIRYTYEERGFSAGEVPNDPLSGMVLK
jgi:hypothetical protein